MVSMVVVKIITKEVMAHQQRFITESQEVADTMGTATVREIIMPQ
jgi:hypothetical protein